MSDGFDLLGNVHLAESRFGAQVGQGILQTHAVETCSGEFCCIHNPSDHPLKNAPLNWRGDRGIMERICAHGIGHHDPDDLAHIARTRGETVAHYEGIHGCDGCCQREPSSAGADRTES